MTKHSKYLVEENEPKKIFDLFTDIQFYLQHLMQVNEKRLFIIKLHFYYFLYQIKYF